MRSDYGFTSEQTNFDFATLEKSRNFSTGLVLGGSFPYEEMVWSISGVRSLSTPIQSTGNHQAKHWLMRYEARNIPDLAGAIGETPETMSLGRTTNQLPLLALATCSRSRCYMPLVLRRTSSFEVIVR